MIWFIQNIFFSISLIVIIHYLYLYFESTLTTPKVKDLIHCPKLKYHSLFETINRDVHTQEKNMKSSSYTADSIDYDESKRLGLGIVSKQRKTDETYDDNSDLNGSSSSSSSSSSSILKNTSMKNDLKTFLRTIGLKKQTTQIAKAPYEMK